jgi:hypothetical protein
VYTNVDVVLGVGGEVVESDPHPLAVTARSEQITREDSWRITQAE